MIIKSRGEPYDNEEIYYGFELDFYIKNKWIGTIEGNVINPNSLFKLRRDDFINLCDDCQLVAMTLLK